MNFMKVVRSAHFSLPFLEVHRDHQQLEPLPDCSYKTGKCINLYQKFCLSSKRLDCRLWKAKKAGR